MKLETFDLYATPVNLTYKGNKVHPTKVGGVITILNLVTASAFLASRLWLLLGREGDDYS